MPNFVANFAKPLPKYGHFSIFGRPFVKWFALCYRTVVCPDCLSACPVCNVGVYCGQTVGWIKMKLGMQVGLSPGHIVLDGDPALPPQKKGAQPPLFGPCLLWPNSWMDQDATWYEGRPRPGQHCVRCGPSSTPWGTAPAQFSAMSVVA